MAWRGVAPRFPCPICGKPDWCAITDDGNVVKCMRITDGAFKVCDEGLGIAAYHRVGADQEVRIPPKQEPIPKRGFDELYQIHRDALLNRRKAPLELETALCDTLGLPHAALRAIGLGLLYSSDMQKRGIKHGNNDFVWTMPMRNEKRRIVGFRLRTKEGFKFSLSGGCGGMFLPEVKINYKRVYVVEGPTDLAACLAMGYPAIGRQNNSGNPEQLVRFMKDAGTKEVCIVLDNDPAEKPEAVAQTLRGGEKLEFELTREAIRAKVMKIRDGKDARNLYEKGHRKLQLQEIT